MPLNDVFARPNLGPGQIDVSKEKPYFTLWLLMLSIDNFLDPDTALVQSDADLEALQEQAKQNPALTINYLDLRVVATKLSTLDVPTCLHILKACLANFQSTYAGAITDFKGIAADGTVNLYPVEHGCTGVPSVLDVLKAPVSPPGAKP